MVSWLFSVANEKKFWNETSFLKIIIYNCHISSRAYNNSLENCYISWEIHSFEIFSNSLNANLEHSRNVFYCFVRFSFLYNWYFWGQLMCGKNYIILLPQYYWITQLISPFMGMIICYHYQFVINNIKINKLKISILVGCKWAQNYFRLGLMPFEFIL